MVLLLPPNKLLSSDAMSLADEEVAVLLDVVEDAVPFEESALVAVAELEDEAAPEALEPEAVLAVLDPPLETDAVESPATVPVEAPAAEAAVSPPAAEDAALEAGSFAWAVVVAAAAAVDSGALACEASAVVSAGSAEVAAAAEAAAASAEVVAAAAGCSAAAVVLESPTLEETTPAAPPWIMPDELFATAGEATARLASIAAVAIVEKTRILNFCEAHAHTTHSQGPAATLQLSGSSSKRRAERVREHTAGLKLGITPFYVSSIIARTLDGQRPSRENSAIFPQIPTWGKLFERALTQTEGRL